MQGLTGQVAWVTGAGSGTGEAAAPARIIQCHDMGEIIAFLVRQPAHVRINEGVVSPTRNRGYQTSMGGQPSAQSGARNVRP